MGRRPTRLPATRTVTDALVLRVIPYGEADAIVTYLTEELGKIAALGRGARHSKRRLAGALEPMHTHRITVDEKPNAELATLVESHVLVPRFRLIASLDGMEAAGQAMRWIRSGSPWRTKEPAVWEELVSLLDRLDAEEPAPWAALAGTGLRLLLAFGYGLDFDACVRCGRARPIEQSAYVAPAAGGVVCRACGGARHKLDGARLGRLSNASRGEGTLTAEDARIALPLIEEALASHADVES